jgi:hypothetical protein
MTAPREEVVVTPEWIEGVRINYGLDTRTPHEAALSWVGGAPAGAVSALGHALNEIDALRERLAAAEDSRREARRKAEELSRDSARSDALWEVVNDIALCHQCQPELENALADAGAEWDEKAALDAAQAIGREG